MTDKTKEEQGKDFHTRMYEIAHSYVMVYNPTEEDYVVKYSMAGIHQYGERGNREGEPPHPYLIPAKKKVEVPYHIGEKYYKEMSDKLINEEADKQAKKQRKAYKGDPALWGDWWEKNWRGFVDYVGMKKRLRDVLILGITREYKEEIPKAEPFKPRKDDVIEQFEGMKKYTSEEEEIIEENKESFIKQVTQ